MKFNFKKIASVLAGAVMLTSTVAFAAAANYPAPFVKSGNADVAIVYGTQPGAEVDTLAAIDISNNLQVALAKQTASSGSTSGTTTTSGETVPLFTSGTKLYINDSLNAVKTVLTDSDLPTLLADGSFSGNVDASYTQTIDIGSTPRVKLAKQPTSSDDPDYVLEYSSTQANYIYNATVTFSKAVNFTHADSKGADITLFGQKFTVASATDTSNLVLLKTAEKVSLTSDDTSATVTINGKEYTVELISASDTAATIKVTDSDGNTETKEVNENASKKIQGITVAVTNADETNLKLSASVIAGAEKITIPAASNSITYGEDAKVIQGTTANITGGTTAATKITVSVYAEDSDKDGLRAGESFTDPVFGNFKVDFAGLSIGSNASASREDIVVRSSGDEKMQVTFTPASGDEKSIQWVYNRTGGASLQVDSDGHNITVAERDAMYRNDYAVVGNEESGRLLKLTTTTNATGGSSEYSSDSIVFTDYFTGDTYTTTITADGTGNVVIGGKSYGVTYTGASSSPDGIAVRLNYPDSTASSEMIVYPTIKTSKGARIAFYEPTTIAIKNWDGASTTLATLDIPDGDGYTQTTFAYAEGLSNWTIGGAGTGVLNTTTTTSEVNLTIGKLTYALRGSGTANSTTLYLRTPGTGALITDPALVIFEEKDDNSEYQALVVTLEAGASSDDGIGVDEVYRTWMSSTSSGSAYFKETLASDSKKVKSADLFGTIITVDSSDSDQKTATISYPDEQAYANIYIGQKASTVETTDGTTTSGTVKELGSIIVKDGEVSQVSAKNLIVVGGSCVNKLSSELLGGSYCGGDFEQKTGVGAGSFLIQTFSRTGGKVATLVAGYHAQDTVNAAKYLTTQTVDTTTGKKYKGTSATTAQLVTTSAETTTATNQTNTTA